MSSSEIKANKIPFCSDPRVKQVGSCAGIVTGGSPRTVGGSEAAFRYGGKPQFARDRSGHGARCVVRRPARTPRDGAEPTMARRSEQGLIRF